MSVEIRPVPVPDALGTREASAFEEYADLGSQLERANWGHDHFADTRRPTARGAPERHTPGARVPCGVGRSDHGGSERHLVGT